MYISKYKRRAWGLAGYYRSKGISKDKARILAERRTIDRYGLRATKGIYGVKTNTERFRQGVRGIQNKLGISEREARKRLIEWIAFKKEAKLRQDRGKDKFPKDRWIEERDKISP